MIFIVGNSRSGTTMLGRVFGLHSDVHTFAELQYFENVVGIDDMRRDATLPAEHLIEIGARLLTTIRNGLFETTVRADLREDISSLIAAQDISNPMDLYETIIRRETETAEKHVPCEQTPRYLFVTEALLQAFPEARFIHIYRDPRAVLLSQKNRWRRGFLAEKRMPLIWIMRSWSNYHPYLTSRVWAASMKQADRLRSEARFIEVSYEDLLKAPEPSLRQLCDHVGITFEPEMLAVQQIGSSSQKDRESKTGFDQSRISAWEAGGLTKAEIETCERTTGPVMAERGYTPSQTTAGFAGRGALWATLLPKGLIAVVLNFKRFTNIRKTVARRL